jgi:hypothetical protein
MNGRVSGEAEAHSGSSESTWTTAIRVANQSRQIRRCAIAIWRQVERNTTIHLRRPRGRRPRTTQGIIFIGRKFGKPEVELGIMVVLMPAYRYGSRHLDELSRAVAAFQRFGRSIVGKACNDPDGIMLLIREGPSPSPTTPNKTTYSPGSLAYVPQSIKVFRRNASDERFATAFMEAVGWLSSENPSRTGDFQREVQVREGKMEMYERCARLVSGAYVWHWRKLLSLGGRWCRR